MYQEWNPKILIFLEDVVVEITRNLEDYSLSEMTYTYYKTPHVYWISPQYGPLSGNTLVTIRGEGFKDFNFICKFGYEQYTHAISVHNDTIAYCRS